MSKPPLAWINLVDAGVVRLTREETLDATNADLETLRELSDLLESNTHLIQQTESAPWNNAEISALLDARNWSQIVIITDEISTFALAFATTAMERGYDTFVACHNLDRSAPDTLIRLQRTGAKILLFTQFLEECRLAANR